MPGFVVVPRDDPDALAAAVSERTAAVLLEPIQGETGIWPISERELLAAAREACDRAGALLMFDEIQCGMGRTGTLWAFELTGVRPDVLTVAKALGGGLPIGACVAGGEAAEVLAARRPRHDLRRRARSSPPRRSRRSTCSTTRGCLRACGCSATGCARARGLRERAGSPTCAGAA